MMRTKLVPSLAKEMNIMFQKIELSKGGNKKAHWGAVGSCLLAFCFALAFATASLAQDKIYVESNDPGGNAVLFYTGDTTTGALTFVDSYSTGGDGLYTLQFGPYDNDGPVIVNSNHSLLFAVNGGSDTIAVFHINGDGTLTAVDGSPFPSGGKFPVGLALSGNTLIVVNKSKQEPTTPVPFGGAPQALPNYSTFTVNNDGSLTLVSTLEVGYDNSPSQALAARQGGMVFGDDFVGGLLRTFKVSPSGQIVPLFTFGLPASEFGGAPHWPLGMAANGFLKLLYVGFPTASKVGVYSYDAAGHLTFLRSAANSGLAICWLALDPMGPYLYTTNNIDASVSTYTLTDPTTPVESQHLILTLPTTSSPFQLQVDPSGKFLYIVGQSITTVAAPPADAGATAGGNVIHVLSINSSTGELTEVGTSPTSLGTPNASRAQGMVVF
jgi:hypothetical protein